jgi:hypothetical protein
MRERERRSPGVECRPRQRAEGHSSCVRAIGTLGFALPTARRPAGASALSVHPQPPSVGAQRLTVSCRGICIRSLAHRQAALVTAAAAPCAETVLPACSSSSSSSSARTSGGSSPHTSPGSAGGAASGGSISKVATTGFSRVHPLALINGTKHSPSDPTNDAGGSPFDGHQAKSSLWGKSWPSGRTADWASCG